MLLARLGGRTIFSKEEQFFPEQNSSDRTEGPETISNLVSTEPTKQLTY